MTELALEVARLGVDVRYVAEEPLSFERRTMGWSAGELVGVKVYLVTTATEARALVDQLPANAVHITQGVRSNGLVGEAQTRIMALGRQHYPIMEKVDLRGVKGRIRMLIYAWRFWTIAHRIKGILAIGEGNAEWISRLSPRSFPVFRFAYFLKGRQPAATVSAAAGFRIAFVGGLARRKRVDLLIDALAGLADRAFSLDVIGSGSEQAVLAARAEAVLPGRVTFQGTLDMSAAIDQIAGADCLVLPSDHDGWGAVVSEAQINGTPAVCSSACGAAGTVRASRVGAVFEAGDVDSLRRCLAAILDRGPLPAVERERLADWALCLTAAAGARYLLEIVRGSAGYAPWELDDR